jgi:hypothetical protein
MLAPDSVLLGYSVYQLVAVSVFISLRASNAAGKLSESVSAAGISPCLHGRCFKPKCRRLPPPKSPKNLKAKLSLRNPAEPANGGESCQLS